jgi:HEAT repeat protein
VLARAARGKRFPEQVVQRLSAIEHQLLDLFAEQRTPARARALGWYPSPEAAEALRAAAGDPDLRLAAIDGLEKMGADDVLAELVNDPLARRAFARRRDPRALRPALDALDDEDTAVIAAHALIMLRAPAPLERIAPALVERWRAPPDRD